MVLSNQHLQIELYDSDLVVRAIIDSVLAVTNIPYALMKAKTRNREIVYARHMAMYFLKLNTKLTLKQIGMQFGGRDHSSVIHAVQQVKDLQIDRNYKEMFVNIEKVVKNSIKEIPSQKSVNFKIILDEVLFIRKNNHLTSIDLAKLIHNETNQEKKDVNCISSY